MIYLKVIAFFVALANIIGWAYIRNIPALIAWVIILFFVIEANRPKE